MPILEITVSTRTQKAHKRKKARKKEKKKAITNEQSKINHHNE